ncbi:MAG: pseudouridine synthase family protein [Thermoplasmataceae archaeon]
MVIAEHDDKRGYLIKFSYYGPDFLGFSLNNNENSVEATLKRALLRNSISEIIKTSSRTDKFVSAISNCMYIESNHRPEKILGILNSEIPNMRFHSWAEVPKGFNPRHSIRKTYAYLLKCEEERKEHVKETLLKFVGTHDFKNFCKVDTRNTIRTVEKMDFKDMGKFLSIEITGKSFLWQQIRFMIGYANTISLGENSGGDPFSGFSGRPVPASPFFLFLKEIYFDNITFHGIFMKHSKIMEQNRDIGYFSFYFFGEAIDTIWKA